MTVFLCYQCSYDYCNVFEQVQEVFLSEEDAMNWELADTSIDKSLEWREHQPARTGRCAMEVK